MKRLSLLGLVTSLAVPWASASDTPKTPEQAARVESVRAAYARLAELTGGSLRYQLHEFKFLSAGEAADLRLGDVVTFPEGYVVAVQRSVVKAAAAGEGSREEVVYLPRWASAAEARPPAADREQPLLAGLEGLLAKQLAPPASGAAVAVVYRATAIMGRSATTYGAAAAWGPAPEGAPVLLDYLSGSGLDQARAETAAGPPKPPEEEPAAAVVPSAAALCMATPPAGVPFTDSNPAQFGDEEHTQGNHFLQSGYTYRCHCSEQCVSTCTVEDNSFCAEHPNGDSVNHQRGTGGDVKTHPRNYPESLNQGAVCAIGRACSIRACDGDCSVTVGAQLGGEIPVGQGKISPGISFSWTPDPNSIWTRGDSSTWGCEPCRLKPVRKKARKSCLCPSTPEGAGPLSGCVVQAECEDAGEGEPGYDTCEEAIEAEEDPDCGPPCGDGICEATESDASCCRDCPCQQPGFECEINQCVCTDLIVDPPECGCITDECGEEHCWPDCPQGETCQDGVCQGGGGGGRGGGGGGGGGTCYVDDACCYYGDCCFPEQCVPYQTPRLGGKTTNGELPRAGNARAASPSLTDTFTAGHWMAAGKQAPPRTNAWCGSPRSLDLVEAIR